MGKRETGTWMGNMNGGVDVQMDGWVSGQMDGQTDK